MNNLAILDPQTFLKNELGRRQSNNRRYSLRAFADALGLNPGYLSRVLSGQTTMTVGAAKRVVLALRLSDAEAKGLIAGAMRAKQLKAVAKSAPGLDPEAPPPRAQEIEADAYAIISDMHHYALLEATFLDDFQADPRWLGRRLGITTLEAQYAVDRLLRLGLLKTDAGTKDKGKTTSALKKSQRQILRMALNALESDPIETRSSTGMTMSIDPAKLPLAKQMIQSFMEQLCEFLESGERREVYQLAVNLFGVTGQSSGRIAASTT
jgi:uncharacterized protein (TIGR02147 family)